MRVPTERWRHSHFIWTYSQPDQVDILSPTAQMSTLRHRELKELANKYIGLKRVEMTSRSR